MLWDPAKDREYKQAWRERNPDASRACHIRRRYGVSLEEIRTKEQKQAGKCAVCNEVPRLRLVIDHDHETGKIRDLLCDKCNQVVGLVETSKIDAVHAYLKKWREVA